MEIKKDEDQVISLPSANGNTKTNIASLTSGRRPGCQPYGHHTPWFVATLVGGGLVLVDVSPVVNKQEPSFNTRFTTIRSVGEICPQPRNNAMYCM